MALTTNDIFNAGTGGLEEVSSSTGSDLVATDKPFSGTYVYKLDSTETITFDPTLSGRTDGGASYIYGFDFIVTDTTPTSELLISSATAVGSGGPDWELFLEIDGDLRLDATGTTVGTQTNPLTSGQKHHIDIFWDQANSGDIEVFLDGVSVANLTSTTADTLDTAAAIDEIIFGQSSSSGTTLYVGNIYHQSGATVSSDKLGFAEIYMKQGAQTGSTPDTSALADTVLNIGNWQDCSQTPLSEEAEGVAPEYDTGASAGVVYADGTSDKLGPAGDDRFLGVTIKAVKGVWRMARGTGGGAAQFGQVGNDGGAASDLEQTSDLNVGAGYGNHFHVTETAAVLPSLTEHAAIGFEKDGGAQDLSCAEMWIMILVVPNAPTITALSDTDLEYPKQNYFVGPHEV